MTQPNAAKAAREMYGEVKENNKLIYANDLVNSYAWDTAIIFIQTYSGTSDYANQNKGKSFANTGKNNDKYCNICDMSGNAYEWTTEYSTYSESDEFRPCVAHGASYSTLGTQAYDNTSSRNHALSSTSGGNIIGLRSMLYVK